MTEYMVNEIFYSLQGEGYWTGTPAIFIRLSGCNLKCPWCDTDHSHGIKMTPFQIWTRMQQLLQRYTGCKTDNVLFVITGGEPTIHPIYPLLKYLKSLRPNNKICIETNATSPHYLKLVKPIKHGYIDWVTFSPKLDQLSYEHEMGDPEWKANELKVVLSPDLPPEFVLGALPHILKGRFDHFFIQPMSGRNKEAFDFVTMYPVWRLSVQLHKLLEIR